MATRVRRDVYSPDLPEDHLSWYGRAVAEMKARPFSDPTSWSYQAAVHGYIHRGPWPALVQPRQDNPLWEQCQHQTWFFLPWHRGYLACFEAIVAKAVADLGGPADWALPYWNYAGTGPDARKLPRAFVGRISGGQPNPLWSPRRPEFDSNPNHRIPAGITNAEPALAIPFFPGSTSGGSPGFGGPQTDFMHYGFNLPSGALESQPHNLIHNALGGLMGNPDTAALDPIFWLHHCNIDRLWEVWVRRHGAAANPTAARWRTGTRFRLHDQDGQPFEFSASEMVATGEVLHGYGYDDPAADSLESLATEGMEMAPAAPPAPARLVGASDTGISLEAGRAAATLELAAPVDAMESLEATEAAGPQRAFLNVENLTGAGNNAIYRVLVRPVSATGEALEPVEAGYVSTFVGAGGADAEPGRAREGQTIVLDVTDILAGLRSAGHGAPRSLEVIFEEEVPPDAAPAEGVEESVLEAAAPEPLKVGRLSLYMS